jgi:hypothetical protein
MLFHAPQASQRPDHFTWTAPQAVQVNWGLDLAMRFHAPLAGAGQGGAGRRRLRAKS